MPTDPTRIEAIRARLEATRTCRWCEGNGPWPCVCGGVLREDVTWALAEIERLGRVVAKLQSTSDQLGRHRGHQRKGCYVCDEARAALDYDGTEG